MYGFPYPLGMPSNGDNFQFPFFPNPSMMPYQSIVSAAQNVFGPQNAPATKNVSVVNAEMGINPMAKRGKTVASSKDTDQKSSGRGGSSRNASQTSPGSQIPCSSSQIPNQPCEDPLSCPAIASIPTSNVHEFPNFETNEFAPAPDNNQVESDGDDEGYGGRDRAPKWEHWETNVLIEAKKVEYDEMDRCSSRELIVNANLKWKRVVERMTASGVKVTANRAKNKWSKVVREYMKIIDHQGKSGNACFGSMTEAERKTANLDLDFQEEWIELLASFMAHRPAQQPPAMADSSIINQEHSPPIDESKEVVPSEAPIIGKRNR